MGDGLGLQGAWGLASLQASIRQRQLDRMAQQQQEFQNMIALRGSNRADAQQQILMQEHAAALAERKAQVEQAGLTARSKLYSPGDVLSPTEGAGLPTTPETTLPSTQIGGGMALPGADTTPAPSPPAPTTMTSSPGVTTGKLIYRGTDVQRTGEEQKAMRGRLLANPLISPRDRLAIEMETAGLKVPTGFERPQNQPVMRVNPRTGKVEQIGDAPAGAHFATEPPPKDTSMAQANEYDRSYQFHRTALDKLAKPIEDQQQRLGRLIDTVNQGTPQADALVAPELLTVMAGGQGSGLRMNEAEIARIVGGRSKWQDLKASLQKWSLDPAKANSITPEQRQQMRDLIAAVHDKSQKLLGAVNDAGDSLIDAKDVISHRRVLSNTRKQMQQINEATDANVNPPTKPTAAELIKKYGGG